MRIVTNENQTSVPATLRPLKSKNQWLYQFAIFSSLTVLLLLVYLQVTNGHYFYGEEYVGIWTGKQSLISKKSFIPYMQEVPFEGRPLYTAYFYLTFSKYINSRKSLEAANTVRLVGIISLGMLAYVLYLIFRIHKFGNVEAFLLSILICTLPPFQIYVSRLSCFIFIYSVLLSSISALILFKIMFSEDEITRISKISCIILAIGLLVIALNIYQSTVMVYWAFVLIPLMKLGNEDFSKKKMSLRLALYFSIGFIAMAIYHKMTEIFIAFTGDMFRNSFQRRGVFISFTISDIKSEIIEFINYPFFTALNLWNLFPSLEIGLCVGIIILTGLSFSFVSALLQPTTKKQRVNSLFNLFYKYAFALVVLPLSYMPFIIIRENLSIMIPKHRSIIGVIVAVFLLFYWGLRNTGVLIGTVFNFSKKMQQKILIISLVILTVITTLLANSNVERYFVKLRTNELQYIKDVIQEHTVSTQTNITEIYVIPSDRNILNFFSEFLYLASMTRESLISMTRLALYELGMESDIPIMIYMNDKNSSSENKNILIINMKEFQKRAYKELRPPKNIKPFF